MQLVVLRSPHPLEECRRRLQDNISGWPFSSRPLGGRMIGDHATLSVRYGFNSWRSHLYVHLRREVDGTSVRCRAYMSRIMIAFHLLFAAGIIWQFASIGWVATAAQLILSSAFWSVGLLGDSTYRAGSLPSCARSFARSVMRTLSRRFHHCRRIDTARAPVSGRLHK